MKTFLLLGVGIAWGFSFALLLLSTTKWGARWMRRVLKYENLDL